MAAARVFDREGLGATTNRIANEAGVSIGSLYQYFPNKEALLLALAERHLEQGRATLRTTSEALEGATEIGQVVRGFVQAIVDLHVEHPRMHDLIGSADGMLATTPAAAQMARQIDALLHWLAGELERHLLRIRPDVAQPGRRTELVVATIFEAIHRKAVGTDADPAYVDEIVTLYTGYLAS